MDEGTGKEEARKEEEKEIQLVEEEEVERERADVRLKRRMSFQLRKKYRAKVLSDDFSPVNPFINRTPMTFFEGLKVITSRFWFFYYNTFFMLGIVANVYLVNGYGNYIVSFAFNWIAIHLWNGTHD